MGGKGQKRREKNYKAAHGDNTRLPPPPEPSSIDALPSKLRQLIALSSQVDGERKVKRTADGGQKARSEANVNTKRNGVGKENDKVPAFQNIDNGDGNLHDSTDQRKRKKRKKTQVQDLRFAAEMEKLGVRSSRRERKKEYLKAKKKKNKKPGANDDMDAPKRDKVKFGDIVLAPPKLAVIPKAPKKPLDASQQRLRLQAVEAYRNRRQWMSRPGIHLPQPREEVP